VRQKVIMIYWQKRLEIKRQMLKLKDLDLHWHLQMDLVKPTPMRWDLNLQKVIRKQKRTQMDLNWLIPMH